MRRRQLKRLWARLNQLSTMALSREELLMKLGAARDQSRTAWCLVTIEVAADSATFSHRLDRNKLRRTRLREGRYLLRTNLVEEDPAKLWSGTPETPAGFARASSPGGSNIVEPISLIPGSPHRPKSFI